MCGIIGYIGVRPAAQVLIEGLKSLEYRGYDSAGVAVLESGSLKIAKSRGKIADLEELVGDSFKDAYLGIGHTRWATHGRPSDANSHPHADCGGHVAVVHNGIIENYAELKRSLIAEGHVFSSETDTEVIPHLIEKYYRGDLLCAVSRAKEDLKGAYALVVLSDKHPGQMVGVRKDSPLIIGIGEGEYFFASDIPALIQYTRSIIIMNDGEVAVLGQNGAEVYLDGKPAAVKVDRITWDMESAQKGGFEYFMLKEIHEQPVAIGQTLKGRLNQNMTGVILDGFEMTGEILSKIKRIVVVACGTSYHAGLVGKHMMERLLRIPVEVEIASEYRYKKPLTDSSCLVIAISQSGETADTIAALRESKKLRSRIVAITNVLDSTIAREADDVIYTRAGPEIAVASTKAYITQLTALYLLTLHFASLTEALPLSQITETLRSLSDIPDLVGRIIKDESDSIARIAEYFTGKEDAFFIGRGVDYAVSLEGALKLKEISYIHAEAYAAGELKHGTLALITAGVPVMALCTERSLLEKTVSNIESVRARGGYLIGIAFRDSAERLGSLFDEVVLLPDTLDILSPILTVVPMQILAYYAATMRGCNVDQPRNLAKSVTVE